jgi:hypothetical protein
VASDAWNGIEHCRIGTHQRRGLVFEVAVHADVLAVDAALRGRTAGAIMPMPISSSAPSGSLSALA